MGVAGNSNQKMNNSLRDRKERAAGREDHGKPGTEAIRDAHSPVPAKGKTGGAYGKAGKANTDGANPLGEGGGGGGGDSKSDLQDVNRSTKPARKR